MCNAHELQLAHQCFKNAVSVNQKDVVTWFKLGLIDNAMGHKKAAIEHLSKALELETRSEILEVRSGLYLETGHSQLAKEDSEAACCLKKYEVNRPALLPENWAKKQYD